MAEAKKMMDNPEYQRQMKKITESKEYKESMKKTNEMLSDPNAAAKMEAKVEHMMKRGNDDIKKAAGATMEEAMAAMANPEVMAEMTKMYVPLARKWIRCCFAHENLSLFVSLQISG